jgi:hypothetical protein
LAVIAGELGSIMNRLAFLVVAASLAAGCATDGDDDRPVIPQNEFPTNPGGARVLGRVCVASDLRAMACSTGGAGGFTVAAGTVSTQTAADGTFELTAPTTTDATFTVTSAGPAGGIRLVPTSSAFSTNVIVPAIDADVFARMLSSNGILLDDGTGTVIARVTRNGVPVSGVTASSSVTSPFGPFFDGTSADVFGLDGTGAFGTVIFPGLTAGTTDLTFDHVLGGLETTVNGVQVRNGGITVIDADLTPTTTTP